MIRTNRANGSDLAPLRRRVRNSVAAAMAALVSLAAPALAQTYPTRPITLIVPYPAGGLIDVTTRILADGLKERFGQPVIVVNKPGANGKVGLGELVKAPADGYTLLLNNDGGIGIPPAVDPNFKFEPGKDYAPLAQVIETKYIFMVSSKLPVKTLAEFIAYAKANPGKLNFASPGLGTTPHIATEYFMRQSGVSMVHVPYKGAAPALTDLLGGAVDLYLPSLPTATGQLGSDRVRVLAVVSDRRIKELPEVPTTVEAGLKDFVLTGWLGLFGPSGLPAAVSDRLSQAVVDVVADPRYQEKFRTVGADPVSRSAAAFAPFYLAEVSKWKAFAAQHGIKMDE